jgi:copper ion binding protein
MSKKIKKELKIEGMTCGHCQARVEKALNSLPGVSAKVDLKKKTAKIDVEDSAAVTDEQLMQAVSEAGYEPVSIEERKGIFG